MAGLISDYPEGLDYTPMGTRVFHAFPGGVHREVDGDGKAIGITRQLIDVVQLAQDDWVVYIAEAMPPHSVVCVLKEAGKLVLVEVE